MLYIVFDTVINIWNKTYIKLPIFQLEILRITNKTTLVVYKQFFKAMYS